MRTAKEMSCFGILWRFNFTLCSGRSADAALAEAQLPFILALQAVGPDLCIMICCVVMSLRRRARKPSIEQK